jgi:hypothetical protein
VATKNRMSLLEQLSKYVVEKDKDFFVCCKIKIPKDQLIKVKSFFLKNKRIFQKTHELKKA